MLLLGSTPLPTSDGSSSSQDMPEEEEGSRWGQTALLKQGAQQILLRQGDAIIWHDCALFPLGSPQDRAGQLTQLWLMHGHSRGPKMGAPALTTKCLHAMNMSENISYQGGRTGEVLDSVSATSVSKCYDSCDNKTELGL